MIQLNDSMSDNKSIAILMLLFSPFYLENFFLTIIAVLFIWIINCVIDNGVSDHSKIRLKIWLCGIVSTYVFQILSFQTNNIDKMIFQDMFGGISNIAILLNIKNMSLSFAKFCSYVEISILCRYPFKEALQSAKGYKDDILDFFSKTPTKNNESIKRNERSGLSFCRILG